MKVPAAVLTAEPAAVPEIGLALDLSRGGILLRLGSAKAPGMPIRVTLTFRHRPQLVLTGKVVDLVVDLNRHVPGICQRMR